MSTERAEYIVSVRYFAHPASPLSRLETRLVPVLIFIHKKGGPKTAVRSRIVDNFVDKVEKERG